jgi:aryl-alcohol dehydrogenase-like predicted oxidoreductase
VSEERLGSFLASLTAAERAEVEIATKFGEHWDAKRVEPYVDHSRDALVRSLEGSMHRLGRIDFLQLHKTTPEVLRSQSLAQAWDFARSAGITRIGASVSDAESAAMASEGAAFSIIQAPYNAEQVAFEGALLRASSRGMFVAVNRPFGMGRLLYERREMSKTAAFAFIVERGFHGVILSGTKSPVHLEENWRAFGEATTPR